MYKILTEPKKTMVVELWLWDKVFKNGPSKMCGRQGFKNLKWYGLLTYHLKFFKGCLPQILLGLFLNTLPHMQLHYGLIFNISLFRQVLNQKTKLNLGKWWWKTECLYTCWSGSGAWELGVCGQASSPESQSRASAKAVKKCKEVWENSLLWFILRDYIFDYVFTV